MAVAALGAGRPHPPPPSTVLCLRALGLGDLLTVVPALRALADAMPERRLVLAAPAALAPLAMLTGAVDEVLPAHGLAPLAGCRGAELAVNLHGCGPESHRVLLETEPRRLLAYRHREVDCPADAPEWDPDEHEVTRWCRLLAESGIPADRSRLDLPRPPAPTGWAGAAIVHPGAASGARRWPPGRWAAVAAALREEGRPVAVTGAASERALAEAVARQAGLADDAVLAGRTDVLELAALVAHAGCVLSGDTGLAHLATAFGTPSVVLFGPTPPSRWGPPASRARHIALWAGSEGDPHGAETFPGLLEIDVADVLSALQALAAPVRPAAATAARAAAR